MGDLTEHFSWAELTRTDRAELQASNRIEAEPFRPSVLATAKLMEQVRAILGVPVKVNSGFRGSSLNAAVGGSKTSQHMKGEACDWVPVGMALDVAFALLSSAVEAGRLKVGQLLSERGWIHVSLGAPYRDAARCGEIGRQRPDGSVSIDRRVA